MSLSHCLIIASLSPILMSQHRRHVGSYFSLVLVRIDLKSTLHSYAHTLLLVFAPAWIIGVAIYCRHRLEDINLSLSAVPSSRYRKCSSADDVTGRGRHDAEIRWGRRCGWGILTFLSAIGGLIALLYLVSYLDGPAHSMD